MVKILATSATGRRKGWDPKLILQQIGAMQARSAPPRGLPRMALIVLSFVLMR